MEFENLKQYINSSLNDLYNNEKDLFNYDSLKDTMVAERNLSFTIGHYLKNLIKGYSVDCEYNRNIDGCKTIDGEIVYPDIIIHKRHSNDFNIAWIEVKKFNSYLANIESDMRRLSYVTKNKYNYKFGVMIILYKRMVEITYFKDGHDFDYDIIYFN